MTVGAALEAGDPRQVGRYRIVSRLGAGGMGRVYLGHSPGGRAMAVKVVRPDLAGDGHFRRRFAREVAAARRVNGVFTAAVVDADPDGDPPWLATAYVPGLSLDDAVTAHGPWAPDSVLALGAGLAEALEAIHTAGVVHRDLKPTNVLLSADGPRVIDFGISVAGTAEADKVTKTGDIIGTPGFMSPEQVTGGPVGPAADVFALGVVLAWTATGEGPFGSGPAIVVAYRAVHEEPDLARLPAGLRDVVRRCLSREPERRPGVPELLELLTAARGDRPATARLSVPEHWLPAPVARAVRRTTAVTGPEPTVVDPAPGLLPEPVPAPAPGRVPDVPPGAAGTAGAEASTRAGAVAGRDGRAVAGGDARAEEGQGGRTDAGTRAAPGSAGTAWLRRAVLAGSAVLSAAALAVSAVLYVSSQREDRDTASTAGPGSVVPSTNPTTSPSQTPTQTPKPTAPTTTPPPHTATPGADVSKVPVTFVLAGVIRSEPSKSGTDLGEFGAGRAHVYCRTRGGNVNGLGDIWNSWWLLTDMGPNGSRAWVSAYYLNGDEEAKAADGSDVPDCTGKVLDRAGAR
ncbi:protein kinase [Streptomyces sp. NPDC048603]|uniref:serine/threonine-protein kinase n=1 Tax=Streptomyces sp. NPDC048603 TaxID=3365577 RepID=UPI00372080D1